MAVIKKLKHKKTDEQVVEYDIGVKAENVEMTDGSALEQTISSMEQDMSLMGETISTLGQTISSIPNWSDYVKFSDSADIDDVSSGGILFEIE